MEDSEEEDAISDVFDLAAHIPNFSTDASANEALCFAESLLVCAKSELLPDTQPIGGYCVDVERMGPESREFLVNVAASMNVEGCFAGGSKLVASLTQRFQCLEEKRTEYLHRPNGTYEKCLFIGSQGDFYHIRIERTFPDDSFLRTQDVSFERHSKLLCEAGHVVLMRYLALTNFHGTFTLESLTIDGRFEVCDYRCNSAEWKKLDGRCLEVYSVERRNVNEENKGKNRESKTLLTRQGRILRHDWLNIPFLLRINPLVDPRIIDKNDTGLRRPLRDVWSEDFELLARYLDRKNYTSAQHGRYLADHPEVKQLIADYVQALLFVKPIDVIGFTIQHFRSFAANPESIEEDSSSSEKL